MSKVTLAQGGSDIQRQIEARLENWNPEEEQKQLDILAAAIAAMPKTVLGESVKPIGDAFWGFHSAWTRRHQLLLYLRRKSFQYMCGEEYVAQLKATQLNVRWRRGQDSAWGYLPEYAGGGLGYATALSDEPILDPAAYGIQCLMVGDEIDTGGYAMFTGNPEDRIDGDSGQAEVTLFNDGSVHVIYPDSYVVVGSGALIYLVIPPDSGNLLDPFGPILAQPFILGLHIVGPLSADSRAWLDAMARGEDPLAWALGSISGVVEGAGFYIPVDIVAALAGGTREDAARGLADALGLGEEYDDLITDPAFVAGQRGGRLIGLIESLGLGAISGGVRTTIPTVQLVRPGAALGGSGALVLSDAVALVIEGKVVIVTPEALAVLGRVLEFAKKTGRIGQCPPEPPKWVKEFVMNNFNNPNASPGPDWSRYPPGNPLSNLHNLKTDEYLRPEISHPLPIGPHWDYKDANGCEWRIYSDGSSSLKTRKGGV